MISYIYNIFNKDRMYQEYISVKNIAYEYGCELWNLTIEAISYSLQPDITFRI